MTTLATPTAPSPPPRDLRGWRAADAARGLPGLATERDEAAARRALRAQIARLEEELAPHALEALASRPRSFAHALTADGECRVAPGRRGLGLRGDRRSPERVRGAANRTGVDGARPLPGTQAAGARAAPRLLSLGELEVQRDALAAGLREERAAKALVADRQEEARLLREDLLRDPAAHPYVRVSNADVGEPGCLDHHVRPRFGLLGMLMRWWRVRISSGCP
jgi:hypothetical protein